MQKEIISYRGKRKIEEDGVKALEKNINKLKRRKKR